MRVNGIIAEYNPFHNGHKYQLKESRRLTGADYTVVVMSGSFVQRGAPALLDKHLRAEAALRCGADLVLELPVLYAVSSAEFFAAGAVALLDRLGVVTHLCFGSECGDAGTLGKIAEILSEEPEEYRAILRSGLKQGASYPKARLQALYALNLPDLPQGCNEILSSPNNILGIEYIRALRRRGSAILPVTVKRLGAGYHDALLPDGTPVPDGGKNGHGETAGLCSALSIRQAIYEGQDISLLACHMPPEAAELLRTQLKVQKPLYPDDFSSVLYYKLIMERTSGYEKYLDVSSDLSNRIVRRLRDFTGFEAFCGLLKTKDMTYTRISRCLLHILLGIERKDMTLVKALDYVPYARVLGFRRSAAPLLSAIGERASLPLVTRIPMARKSLSPEAGRLLELDILASDLYREIARAGSIHTGSGHIEPAHADLNEISAPPVML